MIPDRLKKGDTIGIVAPSKPLSEVHKDYLDNFKKYVEGLGLKVVFGKNLFKADAFGICAGSGEERAEDINEMFADSEVDAIWCYQGGDCGNEVLDFLDYDLIKKNPKLFLGMSDIDVFLLAINKMTGLVGFNTADSKRGRDLDLDFDYSRESFVERLFEGNKEIKKNSEWKTVREGEAEGRLLGCNITSILKLAGTKYFPDFKDSVLFLEGYTPTVYDMKCKLEQLKQIGVFDDIKGIVLGYTYSFQDSEVRKEMGIDVDVEELVLEAAKDYDFPILKINEFGHKCDNAFLPIGSRVRVDASGQKIELIEDFVK
jgi:muramoyltetrapeptide carboxypeptidase